jgi:predicted RNA-binding Zn ribbon-like protein
MVKTIETIPLDGGRLCFDFINTVYSWKTEERPDFFHDYRDFLAWCQRLSVPAPAKTARSRERNAGESGTALGRVLKLRDILYKVFSSIAQNSSPDEHTEKAFNKYLSSALASMRLQLRTGKASVVIDAGKDPLNLPLFHVLKSCYDAITMDESGRIKQCPSCGWIFYDSTKNNGRQWCNPLTCGSMDKSKRYYWRKKGLP